MIYLISGGSGSGKSAYAEARAMAVSNADARTAANRQKPKPLVYIATLMVFDDEGRARIARHRAMRAGKGFTTLERPLDIGGAEVPSGATVLVECLSTLVSNEMFAPGGAGDDCASAVVDGVERLAERCANLCVVTNEVFSDGISYAPETARYIDALARINLELAHRADEVIEVVLGVPVFHKQKQEALG